MFNCWTWSVEEWAVDGNTRSWIIYLANELVYLVLNTIKLDKKISITICVHSVPVVDIMAEYDLDMSGGLLEVS